MGLARVLAIGALLTTVIRLGEPTPAQRDDEEHIAAFYDWVHDIGIMKDSLDWPYYFENTGRGVIATADIQKDEVFLTVPVSATINVDVARGTFLQPLIDVLDEFNALIWIVANERIKGKESFWAPFLNIMPTSVPITQTWSTEDLHELQDPHLFFLSRERIAHSRSQYSHGLSVLQQYGTDTSNFSHEIYEWASQVVRTRCFQINETLQHVMVPFADLLNHLESEPTWWYEKDGVFYMAGGPYRKGEQVLANYRGDYTNLHMLMDYGFLVPGNKKNSERVFLPLSTIHYDIKLAQLRDGYMRMYYNLDPFETLQFFRLLRERNPENIPLFNAVVSLRAELATVNKCISFFRGLLYKKPTSLERDLVLLKGAEGNRKNAIIFRIEKKKVWIRTMNYCEALKETLKCMPQHLIKLPKYFRLIRIQVYLMRSDIY